MADEETDAVREGRNVKETLVAHVISRGSRGGFRFIQEFFFFLLSLFQSISINGAKKGSVGTTASMMQHAGAVQAGRIESRRVADSTSEARAYADYVMRRLAAAIVARTRTVVVVVIVHGSQIKIGIILSPGEGVDPTERRVPNIRTRRRQGSSVPPSESGERRSGDIKSQTLLPVRSAVRPICRRVLAGRFQKLRREVIHAGRSIPLVGDAAPPRFDSDAAGRADLLLVIGAGRDIRPRILLRSRRRFILRRRVSSSEDGLRRGQQRDRPRGLLPLRQGPAR
mmetsp:Transcript_17139/g.49580  ORF Transcript_17139/g.49580 Transcript_17139/m.49580 type:complete len:283 (-) Transcript_17139:1119-1967(-)